MSIKARLLIPMLLLAAVTAAVILVFDIARFSEHIEADLNGGLNAALEAVVHEGEYYKSHAGSTARFIAGDPAIITALEDGSQAALQKRADKICNDAATDATADVFCVIADASGNVLARTPTPGLYGDLIAGTHEINPVLLGESFLELDCDPAMGMLARSGVPVYGGGGRLLGAVITGARIDADAFVDSTARAFNCEIAVFLADKTVATTLMNPDGTRAVGMAAPRCVADRVLAGEAYTGPEKLMGRAATAKYIPVHDRSGNITGMMFAGVYRSTVTRTVLSFVCAGIFFALVLLAVLIPVVMLLVKRIASPIKELEAIAASSAAGIVIMDRSGVVRTWNAGAENILGYGRKEMIGRTMHYCTPKECYGDIDIVSKALVKGEHIPHKEGIRKHKNGLLINDSASWTPIFDGKGNFNGSVMIFHNVTDKKQMALSLAEAARAANAASEAKSMFLANMSHEIRTPLNGVIGFAELVLDTEGVSGTVKAYLKKIKTSADSLLDIVNNILDISKIESGRIELEAVPFDLQAIFKSCQSIIEPKAAEKGIQLYFYAEPLGGVRLLGDPVKLRQALWNLLSNAVKFTSAGVVKATAILEKSESKAMAIRFEVQDSGIGMDERQIGLIFDSFMQADTSTTRKYGGTGLGLTLAKKIVEIMGGSLRVESVPGLGSKFYFTLPFDTVPEDPAPACPDAPSVVERPVFKGNVLVCEDNLINQEVITSHLLRVGLTPVIAADGKQGLEFAQERIKSGNPFDLILMDIHMPVMDGIETARRLGELGSSVPVIALTANAVSDDRERYLAQGMSDYISKPFTSQELWVCLMKYLSPETPKSPCPAPLAHGPEPLIQNEVLNEVSGIERTSGDPRLYRRIQRDFIHENLGVAARFKALAEQGDAVTLHRSAHSLKSAARAIGAEKLADSAQDIETALAKGDQSLIKTQLETLENAFLDLLEVLGPTTYAPIPGHKKNSSLDVDKAAALLDELAPLLKAGYSESMKYIERIGEILSPLGAVCDDLAAQMEDYEFEAAYALLTQIQESLRR